MFTTSLTTQATQSAEHAIQSTQRAAHDAIESLASAAHYGTASVLHTSKHLRDSARRASNLSISFIQREPVKSILVAAATGAALMALIERLSRPHAKR